MTEEVDPKLQEAVRKAYTATNKLFEKPKHQRLKEWGTETTALDKLYEHSGDFFKDDPKSLLVIECIALNTLYKTRLRYIEIILWAKRLLEEFMKTKGVKPTPTVKEIEELRRNPPEGARRANVFIPKFFHFFVDKNEYPIIDSFACRTVGIIFGRTVRNTVSYDKYTEYINEIAKMAGSDDKPVGFRELDRFLWIAGHFYELKNIKKRKKMSELREKYDVEIEKIKKQIKKVKSPEDYVDFLLWLAEAEFKDFHEKDGKNLIDLQCSLEELEEASS